MNQGLGEGSLPSLRPTIESSLGSITSLFRENDLAYLALTSKVENPSRDALAIKLHESLEPEGMIVAREWRSRDIAVLASNSPEGLIECKASLSFDAFGKPYPMAAVLADIDKARQAAVPETEIFVLLFVTHPGVAVESYLREVVKYSDGINRAIERQGSANAVRDGAKSRYSEAFSSAEFGLVTTGEIAAGESFGIPVTIDYWLASPG